MPFLNDTRQPDPNAPANQGFDPQAYVPPELSLQTSDLTDVATAFLHRENTVGAMATALGERWDLWVDSQGPWGAKADATYDPFSDPENLALIEQHPDLARSFSASQTATQSWRIRKNIDQEFADQETMAQGGAAGTALMFGMGALDPVNLLPAGTAFRAWNTGRVLKGAAEGAAAGFVSSAIAEPIFQATQETRTPEESIMNIAAATVLSGALGGGMGLLHPKNIGPVSEAFKADYLDAHAAFNAPEGGGGAGGAQRVETTTLSQETRLPMLGEALTRFVVDAGAGRNPVGNPLQRLLSSPAVEVRRIVQKLAENPLIMKGATEDIAAPVSVQTRFKMLRAGLERSVEAVDFAFNEHRFGRQVFAGRARAAIQDLFGGDPNKLNYNRFKDRLSMALRNGDEDIHGMKEISDAAKKIRPFLDELKDRAIKANLLPEDVEPKTAVSYLTRVYMVDKIARQRPEFEARAVRYLQGLKDAEGLDAGDVQMIARDITDKILGNNGSELTTFDLEPNKRGAAKERTFLIPDKDIEDFLDNDVERVLRIYHRKFGADVELATTFGRADMRDQITEVTDAYARVRQSVVDNKKLTEAQREKQLHGLQTSLESDLRDIGAIRDRLRGRYGIPENPMGMMVRAGRIVKGANYLRLMGGVMPGSIPDVGSLAGYHGMGRLMRHGIAPLVTNLKKFKLNMKETKLAGAATDLVLDTRAMSWADIGEDYGRYSGFEKALKYASDKFGLINVSSQWNHVVKHMSGAMSQTRTLEAVEAVVNGTATQKELTRLHFLGIDRSMAERIHNQYQHANFLHPDAVETANYWREKAGGDESRALDLADKFNADDPLWMTSGARQSLENGGSASSEKLTTTHGQAEEAGGLRFANTERWSDKEAVEHFRAAMLKETDATIISPGEEKPLWMSTEWGGILGQFRSFTLSSMLRVTAAGLQRKDAAALQGLIMMTSLGMLAYFLKVRTEDLSDDPVVWVKEGVDRGGVLGWIFEANNMLEKLAGGVGIDMAIGNQPSSRYAGRGPLAAFGGPSVGLGEDALAVLNNLSRGEMTASDIHKLRKLLPFQNVFWLRYLVDQVEKGAVDAAGLPPRPERRSN